MSWKNFHKTVLGFNQRILEINQQGKDSTKNDRTVFAYLQCMSQSQFWTKDCLN